MSYKPYTELKKVEHGLLMIRAGITSTSTLPQVQEEMFQLSGFYFKSRPKPQIRTPNLVIPKPHNPKPYKP